MKKIILVVCVFLFAAVVAKAVTTVGPENGFAKAKIIAPLELDHDDNAQLNFGVMFRQTGGSVVVPADGGVATYTGVVKIDGVAGWVAAPDHFIVTNPDDVGFSVTLPTTAIITRTGGSETMQVSSFVTDHASETAGTEFHVGATLTVGASQVSGEYTGEYPVSITY